MVKVELDMGSALGELREAIATELGLPSDDGSFKIKRAELGAEVKAVDLTLTLLNIGDGYVLWLEEGKNSASSSVLHANSLPFLIFFRSNPPFFFFFIFFHQQHHLSPQV